MTKSLRGLIAGTALLLAALFSSVLAQADTQKEWTILVFLNGHNNLDSFGKSNINAMSTVGSTKDMDVVVQWASEAGGSTKRIHVTKGGYDVVQDMGKPADMGDYNTLVDFVKWGMAKYPAKKYMVDVWDHGNGWHLSHQLVGGFKPKDISYDDLSGHNITTEQLGLAMGQIAQAAGGKIELYGSDACMMAMVEVAGEMATSVKYFAGSEETEPDEGWPYSTFLAEVAANPTWDGGNVAQALSKDYAAAYRSGGVYGSQSATFSAWDLTKLPSLYASVKTLASELSQLDNAGLVKAFNEGMASEEFTLSDYRDLGDFLSKMSSGGNLVSTKTIGDVQAALSQVVLRSDVSSGYAGAHGLSIWLPSMQSDVDSYGDRYSQLQFNQATGWENFVKAEVTAGNASVGGN